MIARHRSRHAVSVVEFVVASSLILVVLLGAGLTLASSQRSIAKDRARDGVTLLATSVLEQAALYGCQLGVDPDAESTPCDELLAPLDEDQPTLSGDLNGDAVVRRSRAGFASCGDSCDVTVEMRSRWVGIGERSDRCTTTGSAPALLERVLTLQWTPAGGSPVRNEFRTVHAAPRSPEFTAPDRVTLAVPAVPGEIVMLAGAKDGPALVRIASPCLSDAGLSLAEAVFPYLDSGVPYSVVRTGLCAPLTGEEGDTRCAPIDPPRFAEQVASVPVPTPSLSLKECAETGVSIVRYQQQGCGEQ